MKKIILSSVFALALLATTGYGVNKSMKSNSGLSDLALANVEALANNELPDLVITCSGNGRGRCYRPDLVPIPGWIHRLDCIATGNMQDFC